MKKKLMPIPRQLDGKKVGILWEASGCILGRLRNNNTQVTNLLNQ